MSLVLGEVPGIRIAGVATAWPSEVCGGAHVRLDNAGVYRALLGEGWETELERRGWDRDHPHSAWGVQTREWTRGTTSGSFELGLAAAEHALERAGIAATELDCIVVATCTPPHITSTLAAKIARTLGSTAAAIDVRAGGAGGLSAWITAARYHGGGCGTSLVVAAESASHYLSSEDLASALLFGDGAAALVLKTDPDAGGLRGAVLGNHTGEGTPFTVPGHLPPDPAAIAAGDFRFTTPTADYRRSLDEAWSVAAEELRVAFPVESRDLAAFLPYAVTRDQVRSVAAPFTDEPGLALAVLEAHGCLGCAGPLVSFARLIEGGGAGGDVAGALAVGGGISWAGLLWQL